MGAIDQMSNKSLVTRLNLATLALLFLATPASAEKLLDPLFRYVVFKDGTNVSEYIGPPDGPYIEHFKDLPKASGPMEVDCEAVKEVGVVINPLGVGGFHYGAKRKYHFQWSHSVVSPEPVSLMRYKRNAPPRFLRNGIKLNKWRADGTIHLTIAVKGDAVFDTDYVLINCEAVPE